jgi:hypothetical protein
VDDVPRAVPCPAGHAPGKQHGGRKMAANGIGLPATATGATHTEVEGLDQGPPLAPHRRGARRSYLGPHRQRCMVVGLFQARYDADMRNTDGLTGRLNTWYRVGRVCFWGVPGRTLPAVIEGIRNGGPRLAMPESPLPSPRAPSHWQPRRTSLSSSHSSSSGPARSAPSSRFPVRRAEARGEGGVRDAAHESEARQRWRNHNP